MNNLFDGVVRWYWMKEGCIHGFDQTGRECWDNEIAERVFVNEPIKNGETTILCGVLGWTIPGSTDGYKYVDVRFDNGMQVKTRTYKLARVSPKLADKSAEAWVKQVGLGASEIYRHTDALLKEATIRPDGMVEVKWRPPT